MSALAPDLARLEFPFSRADALGMEGPEALFGYRVGKGGRWA